MPGLSRQSSQRGSTTPTFACAVSVVSPFASTVLSQLMGTSPPPPAACRGARVRGGGGGARAAGGGGGGGASRYAGGPPAGGMLLGIRWARTNQAPGVEAAPRGRTRRSSSAPARRRGLRLRLQGAADGRREARRVLQVVVPGRDDLAGRHDVTAMFMTAALFARVVAEKPDTFRTLDTLLVGGEVVSPDAARRVLAGGAPRRLLNGYGPTETTTFATVEVISDVPEGAESIPIGRAIAERLAKRGVSIAL